MAFSSWNNTVSIHFHVLVLRLSRLVEYSKMARRVTFITLGRQILVSRGIIVTFVRYNLSIAHAAHNEFLALVEHSPRYKVVELKTP